MSGEGGFPGSNPGCKGGCTLGAGECQYLSTGSPKIAAWGGSAGGYQASMLGISAGISELEDLRLGNPAQSIHVQAVVDWFGRPTFLTWIRSWSKWSGTFPWRGAQWRAFPRIAAVGSKDHGNTGAGKGRQPGNLYSPRAATLLAPAWYRDNIVPCLQSIRFAQKLITVLGNDESP